MLTISQGQASVLRAGQLERFKQRTATYLAARYTPDQLPAHTDWMSVVTGAIRLANQKGLHSELAVATLCELGLSHGFAFHQEPWAAYVLDGCDAEEAERVARLREYLP